MSGAPASGGQARTAAGAGDPPAGGCAVTESAGTAGTIPALLVEGLATGLRAGLTTSERNFRFRARGTDAAVAAAYAELDRYARPFGGWVRAEQVHGGRVLRTGAEYGENAAGAGRDVLGEADGLVLREPARGPRLLTVTVADCVPVFLAWEGGYGLLHAGWRGTAAGVLEAGVLASGGRPDAIRVHLGPAIGGCCYEVGPEVVEALYAGAGGAQAALDEGAARSGRNDRLMLDLRRVLAGRAARFGIPPRSVSSSAWCTACDPGFHSFRAGGGGTVVGLMLAFAGREGSPG